MVQIIEFRVPMPLSVEEYQVGQMYMVTKMQQENTAGKEGVKVLENREFEDAEFGKGQYTHKLYYLQSKVPSWVNAIAPADALVFEEEAWNAFPKCKTVLKCPYFPRFSLKIESIHVADNGHSANVHNLDAAKLAIRQVETIDIASGVRDYWNYMVGGDPTLDLSSFLSKKTGRGKLSNGWQDYCHPVMTAYKLVTVDAPYWGFGYRIEQAVLTAERALFMESHKRCFSWIDEWCDLSVKDVRQIEHECDAALNRKLSRKLDDVDDEISEPVVDLHCIAGKCSNVIA